MELKINDGFNGAIIIKNDPIEISKLYIDDSDVIGENDENALSFRFDLQKEDDYGYIDFNVEQVRYIKGIMEGFLLNNKK